jgi:hypothetical protein
MHVPLHYIFKENQTMQQNEFTTNVEATGNIYVCDDLSVIPWFLRCNAQFDCVDHSDELYCVYSGNLKHIIRQRM